MAKCPNQAFYRFTWPGSDESYICTEHVNQLKGVASAMGMYLQIIPLSHDEQAQHTCNQEVRANTGSHSDGAIVCPNCGYSAFYPVCTKCGNPIMRTAGKA